MVHLTTPLKTMSNCILSQRLLRQHPFTKCVRMVYPPKNYAKCNTIFVRNYNSNFEKLWRTSIKPKKEDPFLSETTGPDVMVYKNAGDAKKYARLITAVGLTAAMSGLTIAYNFAFPLEDKLSEKEKQLRREFLEERRKLNKPQDPLLDREFYHSPYIERTSKVMFANTNTVILVSLVSGTFCFWVSMYVTTRLVHSLKLVENRQVLEMFVTQPFGITKKYKIPVNDVQGIRRRNDTKGVGTTLKQRTSRWPLYILSDGTMNDRLFDRIIAVQKDWDKEKAFFKK